MCALILRNFNNLIRCNSFVNKPIICTLVRKHFKLYIRSLTLLSFAHPFLDMPVMCTLSCLRTLDRENFFDLHWRPQAWDEGQLPLETEKKEVNWDKNYKGELRKEWE